MHWSQVYSFYACRSAQCGWSQNIVFVNLSDTYISLVTNNHRKMTPNAVYILFTIWPKSIGDIFLTILFSRKVGPQRIYYYGNRFIRMLQEISVSHFLFSKDNLHQRKTVENLQKENQKFICDKKTFASTVGSEVESWINQIIENLHHGRLLWYVWLIKSLTIKVIKWNLLTVLDFLVNI